MDHPQPLPPRGDLLALDPVPVLRRRIAEELTAQFHTDRPMRISRAPGRLDVMGGIADYTGSLVCEATLDRAAAVALQTRNTDRQVQIVSLNLLDEHRPCTFGISLDALAAADAEGLRRGFAEPGRRWAGYLAGCLFILHEAGLIDLRDSRHAGLNIALYSSVPLGSGVSSSAAIEVAMMMNLVEHFGIARVASASPEPAGAVLGPMRFAALCQQVENRIVGAPCGIMDQVTSCFGDAGSLLRMVCQPHELQTPLLLPAGIRAIGINSNVRHSVGGPMYGRTRCAAFMAHRMILEKMRQIGQSGGSYLDADPLGGYLANLDADDYKRLFRPQLPETMRGGEFLGQFGGTIDKATHVEPQTDYHVRSAADHHVLEAHRVRAFASFIEEAAQAPRGTRDQGRPLDKAGHLMYASHLSYTNAALLGADECDLLVELCRRQEPKGLYGAKITGGGSGGTVAVLCDEGEKADRAIAEIMGKYRERTGHTAEAFLGTSPGAWHVGTILA
jgi:L-arabinokinase